MQLSGSAMDRKKLNGKRGLIFFKDCFARSGQSFEHRSGDHIDLWDRGRVTGSFADQAHRSKAVWFWELT